MRPLIAIVVSIGIACAPAEPVNPPAASRVAVEPSAAAATPSPTQPATPTSSTPTRIPLPSGAFVAAASGGVVWMFVNFDHLFVSLNRGDTWTERTLPPEALRQSFAAISAGEAWWLTLPALGTQCGRQLVTLWKTDDGGVSWRKLDATGLDATTCKGEIQFSGPGTGFLPVQDVGGPPAIYRTVDGGRSWVRSNSLADPPGVSSRPGAWLAVGNIGDFGSVLFADAFIPANGVMRHFAYRSTDRGTTWSYASPALQSSDITFLTPTRWLQITPDGDSRETTDGGSTWHVFPGTYRTAAPIAPQIVFGDAETGYATVRGTLARTTDGGAHWESLHTPGT